MRNGNTPKIVGLSLVAAMLLGTSALHANATAPVAFDECKVSTTQQLTVREGEQELKVTVTEELAETMTAKFADESKIKVISVTKDTGANTLKIKADASAAAAGDWALTINAGQMECKGDVKVAAAEADAR